MLGFFKELTFPAQVVIFQVINRRTSVLQCPKEVVYENTLRFIFLKNFIPSSMSDNISDVKEWENDISIKTYFNNAAFCSCSRILVFRVWGYVTWDVNSISTGTLSKINFPRNEAKHFRLICLQSYFNLNIQPVLSDNVSSHLSTHLFLEFRSKQQSEKQFWECQIKIAQYFIRLNLHDESFEEYQLMAT
jgi:hypothetical protein